MALFRFHLSMVASVDLDALDPEALRRLMLRRRRTWAAAILGNALVALVLVGGPWLRGHERASGARDRFAALAACLWGAAPAPEPGLTFPDGDLAHYADAAREPTWPARCEPLVDRVLPPPVFFVFPEVRQAEADARRALEVVRREIRGAREAAPGAIPTRPRLAMLRLSAALALVARAADADAGLDGPAIAFHAPARSVLPERVPLHVEAGAALEARGWAEGVALLALGNRALSWVRVGGGRVDVRRLRRTPALQAWRWDGATPWLLWWTPQERCGEDRCAHRALGLAPLLDETVTTPAPVWLAAHPANGARSVALGGGRVWVAARTPSGVELRGFPRPVAEGSAEGSAEGEGEGAEGNTAPRRAEVAWPLPGATEVLVGVGEAWWVADGALHELRGGAEERLAEVGPARHVVRDAGWLAAWGPGLTLLHEDRRIAAPDAEGIDALRLLGAGDRAFVVAQRGDELSVRVCSAEGCGPWWEISSAVQAWDAALDGEALLVAWAPSERGPIAIREVRDEVAAVTFPAPCFDTDALTGEPSGMCGAPTLGLAEGRVLLVAREGTDAWVVERAGGRWRPLRGLR